MFVMESVRISHTRYTRNKMSKFRKKERKNFKREENRKKNKT